MLGNSSYSSSKPASSSATSATLSSAASAESVSHGQCRSNRRSLRVRPDVAKSEPPIRIDDDAPGIDAERGRHGTGRDAGVVVVAGAKIAFYGDALDLRVERGVG